MPRIEDIGGQIGAPGAADIAPSRPSQAFADLGQQAASLEGVLEQAADHDAALEGASALADFRAKRAQRQIELRTQATDPATFAETALADFDEEADKLITGHDNERVQAFLEQRLVDARASEEIESATWAANTIVDRRARKTIDTVNKYANIVNSNPGQFESALDDVDAMIDAAGLPLDVADKQKSTARSALARSAVYGQMEGSPGAVLKQLKAGQWDDFLDNDVKIAAVNAAQGKVDQIVRDAQARASAQASAGAAMLGVRINQFANGQAEDIGQEEVDKMRGVLSPSAWATLQKQYDDARAKRAKDDEEVGNVAAIIGSGGHIDPGNTKQVKAFDQYFKKSVLPELAKAEDPTAAALAFVKQQGIVPETMLAGIRSQLRSGSADEKVAAAATIDQIKTVSPRALIDVDEKTLRQANTLAAYVDGGATPVEAVRMTEEAMRTSKGSEAALEAEYGMLVKSDPTADWLASAHDESWWSTPSVPVAVAAEVGAIARNEFLRNGGNLEAARRTALDLSKKRYGATRVNGAPVVVRNPVEQHYGVPWLTPEQNAKAIKDEAVAELSAGNIEGALTPERVRIQPYPSKGVVAADGRPAYAIEVQDSSGNWTVQMDLNKKSPTFGLPKPWIPSMAAAKAERDEVVRSAVGEAKGELPAGAFVEGTTVYDAPKPVTRMVRKGNLDLPYTETGDGGRRMIGTIVNGKFIRSQPSREKH